MDLEIFLLRIKKDQIEYKILKDKDTLDFKT